jgi:hypothetical protein
MASSNSCKEDSGGGDDRLTTVNNSPDTIFSVIKIPEPDTTILQEGTCTYCFVKIPPNSTYKHFNQVNWEIYINNLNPQNRVSMIIIAPDTLTKYSFSEIVELENFEARYDLTIDQLQVMNWTVEYP